MSKGNTNNHPGWISCRPGVIIFGKARDLRSLTLPPTTFSPTRIQIPVTVLPSRENFLKYRTPIFALKKISFSTMIW